MRFGIIAGFLLSIGAPSQATEAIFSNRTSFISSLGSSFTDTYEPYLGYAAPAASYTDATISAVVGQTKYQAISFPDYHGVGDVIAPRPSGQVYCAGCNGAFKLDFSSTDFGNGAVFGGWLRHSAEYEYRFIRPLFSHH